MHKTLHKNALFQQAFTGYLQYVLIHRHSYRLYTFWPYISFSSNFETSAIWDQCTYEGFLTICPDLTISNLHGTKWKTTYEYGESKSVSQGTSNFLICQDLHRIVILCKDALDAQSMEGVLGLQVIGRTIIFYVVVLSVAGLYVMHELTKIKAPDRLDDLIKFAMDMPQALLVLDVFNRVCVPSAASQTPMRHWPTITETAFNGIFSTFQDYKRSCSLKCFHNYA
ncbi:hypothetical protein RMATCC62417_11325 [Rhizopus microsporus]|nr:hypothetical protein RMATCC62417_11325 [Rhizopus microsporus]